MAVATRDNARQSLETARIEVEQAKENLQTVIEQYRLGEASRVDFTDAAGSYASALGARVKAFYAGEIAEAALIRLTGTVPPRTSPKTGEKKQPQKKAVVPSKPGTYREVTDETID